MASDNQTTLEAQVAQLMCRQRGLDPDRRVIAGKANSAPTEVRRTWEFWLDEAAAIIALVRGAGPCQTN